MKKFFSIEFNKMIDITNDLFLEYYAQNSGTSVKGALTLGLERSQLLYPLIRKYLQLLYEQNRRNKIKSPFVLQVKYNGNSDLCGNGI